MKSELIYSLPVVGKDLNTAVSNPFSHTGKDLHAVDFILPIGTPILASQKGTVVRVYTESNEGGTEEKYSKNINKYTNSISIKHADNEYSEYLHLDFHSEKVKLGQEVNIGDVIALSGNTGLTTQPHLHFHVLRLLDEDKDWESLEVRWSADFSIDYQETLNMQFELLSYISNGEKYPISSIRDKISTKSFNVGRNSISKDEACGVFDNVIERSAQQNLITKKDDDICITSNGKETAIVLANLRVKALS